ncbi:5-formyltetrahydrofolate cyclo-ligase [Leptodontidium sp. MPI-SDFR-AT-0119]|nr:5-formyltetrahydrofolate cyclo-ligase [Leptodontidium sp. MPI-SDFR-AT-0119]
MPSCPSHKASIRSKVWSQLRQVAIPDFRFHHDYSSIADFQGSTIATNHITSLPCYKNAKTIFNAPDNCIQELRYRTLKDGKTVLITTYGIRRGFWILDPKAIPSERWEMASLLDGMERIGRHVTLRDIESMKIDLMVTGTGAINLEGLRFGKGHGYFDRNGHCFAVVHECQVLDEDLQGEAWDTGCDFVVTNERVIVVKDARKPDCGILWDQLQDGMLEDIEPLRELKERR